MKKNIPNGNLIDTHASDWLDGLQDEIAELREKWPNANVFALLDCVFNEHCYAAIRQYGLPLRSLYDLSDNPSSDLQAVSPTLVPLSRTTVNAWRTLLGLTDGWPMLSLIVTPESLDELAIRLNPWCVVNADGETYVLRFPDTRRLPGVVSVLTPEQHGALFGPALAWRYRTRSAQWANLPLPSTPEPAAEAVKLDSDQCAKLIADAEADEIIAHLHIHDPVFIRPYQPAIAHDLIARGLNRADHYGIENYDRMNWCRLLMQQPKLELMPEALPLLAALKAKQCAFDEIRNTLAQLAENNLV